MPSLIQPRRATPQRLVLGLSDPQKTTRTGRPSRTCDQTHRAVKHRDGEYVKRGEPDVHSNTVESVFSLLKRGLMGTCHSVSKKHLHRCLAEFEFRWNTKHMDDGDRTSAAIRAAVGKRLRYKEPVAK